MARPLMVSMLDRNTPEDVIIHTESRAPVTDPTLGIPVTVNRQETPRHRLVTLGDSLTQGYQSGALFKTHLSYPNLVAREMGWSQFRYPNFQQSPNGGLPLNLEVLARQVEKNLGNNVDVWEIPALIVQLRNFLEVLEDYWERGQGAKPPKLTQIYHNLAIYGWDIRNTLSRNANILRSVLSANPAKDNFLPGFIENHNERAGLWVLNLAGGESLSPVASAAKLSEEGSLETQTGDGIETLVVLIGANNALGSILRFRVIWSEDDYANMSTNDRYTAWRPIHFQAELNELVAAVKKIKARHVIWGTIPHVTIIPFARGVDIKVAPGSRYFPYYTLPWLNDQVFDPVKHPHLTSQEVRAVDSAIDQYNEAITEAVKTARQEGRDWYVFETCGALDRLASRRYILDSKARPDWWTPYELPEALQELRPIPDSLFFMSDEKGRYQGGLFSLDGIHPTTIGYGIMAQELIKIMQLAGVKFYQSDGVTERNGEVKIDFQKIIQEDDLISRPPKLISDTLQWLGKIDGKFNILGGLMKASY